MLESIVNTLSTAQAETYQAIINNSRDLIAAVDTTLRFISFNTAYQTAFKATFGVNITLGMSLQDALGHLPQEFANAKATWERALKGEEFFVEAEIRDNQSKQSIYEIDYKTLRSAQGDIIGASYIGHDIQLRKQMRQENQRLTQLFSSEIEKQVQELEQAQLKINEEIVARQQVETLKKKSQERYLKLMQTTYTIMCIWSVNPQGHIVEPQPSWEAFTGQSWSQYQGLGWLEAIHPDDREPLWRVWQKAVTDKTLYEVSYRIWSNASHDYCIVLAKATPLLDEEGEIQEWIGNCLNIHDLKMAQEALHESQEQFHIIADNMLQMVWVTNATGEHEYYNKRWCEYTGLTLEASLGWNFTLALHPDDRERTIACWKHSLETGENYEIEYRFKRACDGMYRWQLGRATPLRNQEGKIIKWFGTCTDIHDLKLAEEKLRSITEQLNITLRAAQIATWRWDITTNQLTVDDYYRSLYYLPPESEKPILLDEEIYAQIHPDDVVLIKADLERAIKGKSFLNSEFRVTAPGQSVRWLIGRGEVFYDNQGQPLYVIGINWDITARKKLETEKVKAMKVAEEHERQRAEEADDYRRRQSEFVDTICHEIRNPLMGIVGSIDLLQTTFEHMETIFKVEAAKIDPQLVQIFSRSFEKVNEQMTALKQCAEHQKVLINDVLDFSKLENMKVELNPIPFQPFQLINQAVHMIKARAEQKSLQLVTNIAPECNNYLQADSHRLLQIIGNLLSNAVKFTSLGTITVHAKLNITLTKPLLEVSVEDTGIGMAKDEQWRLFNRFTQANRRTAAQYGGSGLGLAISKRLVDLMGGTFNVESQEGHGSKFTFTISVQPLISQTQVIAKHTVRCSDKAYQLALSNQPINKKILVVEDNAINQKILVRHLEQRECVCQVANNGLEALEKIAQFSFDLIFMDIEMPVMGGLEATQKIRKNESQSPAHGPVPIIGLSGNARQEQIDAALNTGMNTYLTKPYEKNELYALVYEYTGLINAVGPINLDNVTKLPELSLSWQTAAEQFKKEAFLLVEQHLPFNITEQDNQLTLELLPQPPHYIYYFCKLALEDLKRHLETVTFMLGINQLLLIDGHLKIQVFHSNNLETVKRFLTEIGILATTLSHELKNPLINVPQLTLPIGQPVLSNAATQLSVMPSSSQPTISSSNLFTLKKRKVSNLSTAANLEKPTLDQLKAQVEEAISEYQGLSQCDPDYMAAIQKDLINIAQGQQPQPKTCLEFHLHTLQNAINALKATTPRSKK